MTKVGVMSDSHGIVPSQIYDFFKDVDVIFHAGDIGSTEVLNTLRQFKKIIAVTGNCDDPYMDNEVKNMLFVNIEDVNILMTHIGGYPKHYSKELISKFKELKPHIFICGHSHILKVLYDEEFKFLLINPGACGRQGFHQVGTLVRFVIDGSQIKDLDVMDFNKFGQ